MSSDPLEAHKRLCTMLRHHTRTHFNKYGHDHSRHARTIDVALAWRVWELAQEYSPSTIRTRLNIGYGTIRRAMQLIEELQCQR